MSAFATGGIETTYVSGGTTYYVHTYNATGSNTFYVSSNNLLVSALVVAGGGGGGAWGGGGGGAGGLLLSAYNLPISAYSLFVGNGGVGSITSSTTNAANGQDSLFYTLSARGGGRGGSANPGGGGGAYIGGSGGGGSYESTPTTGAAGIVGQGNNGGDGGSSSSPYPGGGGGGAGAVGANASGAGGNGGNGLQYSINGVSTYYAGGGGGGATSGSEGSGGLGGGGDGGSGSRSSSLKTGASATGGGGGGGQVFGGGEDLDGGDGGSGIIILSYAEPVLSPEASGGVFSTYTSGGNVYNVHTFTLTSANTFTVLNAPLTCDILMVGGGGSGGAGYGGGGGGGAGGLVYKTSYVLPISSYSISVGDGGAGVYNSQGNNGQNTVFYNLTAIGGGNGGYAGSATDATSGGSGGGAPYAAPATRYGGGALQPISTTGGYGNPGGDNIGATAGAGGGGAALSGMTVTTNISGGRGGDGLPFDINGALTYYAGGGGGGTSVEASYAGIGGLGGGGSGQVSGDGSGKPGFSGVDDLGGGGGGGSDAYASGGSGGSGIVIVRYFVSAASLQPPIANFIASPLSGTAPLTVNFTDTSTGSPTAWAWDFDNDGTVDSTSQNPSYIYSVPGTYTVSLTTTNEYGSDSEIKSNYITVQSPAAGFQFKDSRMIFNQGISTANDSVLTTEICSVPLSQNLNVLNDTDIKGDLTVSNSISSPNISADNLFVGNSSIHFYNGTTITSPANNTLLVSGSLTVVGSISSTNTLKSYAENGVFIPTNTVTGINSIAQGTENTASGNYSTVGGGKLNTASGNCSTIGGGRNNTASSLYNVVGGGNCNSASGPGAAILGGEINTAVGQSAFIGGGQANAANGSCSVIGGGINNTVNGGSSFIGSGYFNCSTQDASFIGGGCCNCTGANRSIVVGGVCNCALGTKSFVGGGLCNRACCAGSVIGGGEYNTSSGYNTVIGGGFCNSASNDYGFIGGGCCNCITSQNSQAAGRNARVIHNNSYVWNSFSTIKYSTQANQFLVNADIVTLGNKVDVQGELAAKSIKICVEPIIDEIDLSQSCGIVYRVVQDDETITISNFEVGDTIQLYCVPLFTETYKIVTLSGSNILFDGIGSSTGNVVCSANSFIVHKNYITKLTIQNMYLDWVASSELIEYTQGGSPVY